MPNKLSQFWQELKRRNVVRVVTVYAGTAFVIIELINNVTEPLRLPEWTPTLVIVLLLIGFPIVVIFSWIYDVHPEGGLVKTEPVDRVKSGDIPKSSNSWKIASYISFVVIVVLIVFNVFGEKRGARIDESLAKTIAVLPFNNYTGDPDLDHTCYGLTDETISNLFKVASFDEVRSLTSVRQYQETDKSIPEIAEELDVNYILEGTYKEIGGEMKLTAQLIDRNDQHIWLFDYNLSQVQITTIAGDIALQIVDHLNTDITDTEKERVASIPTENPEAFNLIQKVIYLTDIIARTGEVSLDELIRLAKEAIQLDPEYVDAYAWTGILTIYLAVYMGSKEPLDIYWEAEYYIQKALDLDMDNFRAHFAMGQLCEYLKWDYVKAEQEYLICQKIEPKYPTDDAYDDFFMKMNRPEKAEEAWSNLKQKCENPIIQYLFGNISEAFNTIDCWKSISTPTWIGRQYMWVEEWDSAKVYLEKALYVDSELMSTPRFQAHLAVACVKTGSTQEAQKIIDKLVAMADTTAVRGPAFFTGMYYSWIGEMDQAFYWLEKAYRNRSLEMPWLKVLPAFNCLKDDPRYWDLYERTGHKAYDDYLAGKQE